MKQLVSDYAKQCLLTAGAIAFGLVAATAQISPSPQAEVADRVVTSIGPVLASAESSRTSVDAKTPRTPGNPLWAINLASLNATQERPIFLATRRPIIRHSTANQSVVAPAAAHPDLTLVGVISGEKDGVAIFFDELTKNTIRLKTGDSHLGWVLQSVEGREATLYKAPKTAVLLLPNPPAK